jgi:hypothetical protein
LESRSRVCRLCVSTAERTSLRARSLEFELLLPSVRLALREGEGGRERGKLEKERKRRKERERVGKGEHMRDIEGNFKKWRERGIETGRKEGRKKVR